MMKVWSSLVLSAFVLGAAACSAPVSSLSDPAQERSILPTLNLDVAVDSAARLNVTLTARWVSLPYADDTSALVGRSVAFYVGDPSSSAYPSKYVGSAPWSKEGVAKLSVRLDDGTYAGGAISSVSPTGFTVRSNVVSFAVPAPVTLTLNVLTGPALPVSASFAPVKANVAYVAKLRFNVPSIEPRVKIDFYTAKVLDPSYPSTYLGSAVTDVSGQAILYLYQDPGKYRGGAIFASSPWGPVRAAPVVYQVDEIWTIQ